MRHRKRGKHLGRTASHRKALRRNMACSLFVHGRIRTTLAKAKEVRQFAEPLITLAKKGGLARFRKALRLLDDKRVVRTLFDDIGPRFADRPGGYTRILKLSAAQNRLGDNADQALLELVEESMPEGAGEASSAGEEKEVAQEESTDKVESGEAEQPEQQSEG